MPIPTLAIEAKDLTTAITRTGPVAVVQNIPARRAPIDGVQGYFVEEATTNLIPNPRAQTTAGGWSVSDPTGTLWPDPDITDEGFPAARVVISNIGGTRYFLINNIQGGIIAGQPYSLQARVKCSNPNRAVALQMAWKDASGAAVFGGSFFQAVKTRVGPDGFTTVKFENNIAPVGATGFQYLIRLENGSFAGSTPMQIGDMFWMSRPQFEQKSYCTTYADGSLGTTYAWTGTTNNSASTRAANTAATIPADAANAAINAERGSVYWRSVYSIEPIANARPWRHGPAGGSIDSVMVSVSNVGSVSFTWYSGPTGISASVIAIQSGVSPGQTHKGYGWWDGDAMGLTLNGFKTTNRTRLPRQGLMPGSPMSVGGYGSSQPLNAAMGPIIFFDRPLTDAEVAKLDATPTALLRWDTLIEAVGGIVSAPGGTGAALTREPEPGITLVREAHPGITLVRAEPARTSITRRG